jgi:methionyl-tRNA formyltransferase
VTVLTAAAGSPAPGELRALRDRVVVGTATAPVELGEVQQDGKRRLPAADWARGLRPGSQPAILG